MASSSSKKVCSQHRRNLLLLSNSTLHPTGYLEYATDLICNFLRSRGVKSVTFVPYALRDADGYAGKARIPFEAWGFKFTSVHTSADPASAILSAESIFVGGGNTFQLLKSLHELGLIDAIRRRVLEQGAPYVGSSAGTNVATRSIHTTNDMPIVHVPTFEALGLVPFNINPHYLDTDPDSKHQGETRAERLRQYQQVPGVPPVLALREGSVLLVEGDKAVLKGDPDALLFRGDEDPVVYPAGTDFAFLMAEEEGVNVK